MRPIMCLLLAAGIACGTPSAPPEAEARRIASEVWSPYCPGRLLSECSTSQARELRSDIADRLRRGESPAAVRRWMVENYGSQVLAVPAPGGAGLALWLVPAAIVVTGALLVTGLVLRWRRPAPAAAEAPADAPEGWVERVREEVERDL